jgi:anti-anti-sigma factor
MSTEIIIKMPTRFDYSSSVDFNKAINTALENPGVITLDCSDLEYIDSAGIGLLVMSQKKVQSHQSTMVMVNLKAAPLEIVNLANLRKLIEIQ